jgi:hypothetical protein
MARGNALGSPANTKSAAAVLFTLDVTDKDVVAVQVTSAGTTCTITYEGTLDGVTWYPVAMTPIAGGAAATTSTAVGLWSGVVSGLAQFRARVSTYTSGTVTAVYSAVARAS